MNTMEKILRQADLAFKGAQFKTAKNLFYKALTIEPTNSFALTSLGVILAQQGKPKKAFTYLRAAFVATPDSLAVLVNYGGVCLELKKVNAAKDAYKKALAINPNVPEAHNGLGYICEKKYDLEQSFWHFRQSYLLEPTNPIYIDNAKRLCTVLISESVNAKKQIELLQIINTGLELFPNDLDFKTFMANNLRIVGMIKEGQNIAPDPNIGLTVLNTEPWVGEELSNGRLLVRSEQGVGDQLAFASIIPDLEGKCSDLTIECDHRFVPLLSRSFPKVEFIGWKDPPFERLSDPDITKQISMMNACAIFRPNLASFPEPKPYLVTDYAQTKELQAKYHDSVEVKVIGISWASTKTPAADKKTIPLFEMVKKLDLRDVRILSLQYGDYSEEIHDVEEKLGVRIIQDSEVDPLVDLDSFASAVAACDLVVSSSNVTVHFAGALGIPTWALIPADPFWTWFLERSESVFYESVSLIRRTHDEKSWRPAISRMRESVEKWINNLESQN